MLRKRQIAHETTGKRSQARSQNQDKRCAHGSCRWAIRQRANSQMRPWRQLHSLWLRVLLRALPIGEGEEGGGPSPPRAVFRVRWSPGDSDSTNPKSRGAPEGSPTDAPPRNPRVTTWRSAGVALSSPVQMSCSPPAGVRGHPMCVICAALRHQCARLSNLRGSRTSLGAPQHPHSA